MGVSGISSSSRSPEVLEAERAIIAVKKQQDVAKDQAAGLLDLVKQAAPDGTGQRINVYA